MKKLLLMKTMLLLCALIVGSGTMWADEESVTFSEQGYTNQQEISSYSGTNFNISFAKGSNSNAPKYFTNGTAIRAYGGNSFTVSSDHTITGITLTFGTGDGSNAITTDVNTYENGTWSGSAKSVTFAIGGTTGNRRIAGVTVTYTPAAKTDPEITFNDGSVRVGKNLDLSTLFTSNSTGAVTYSITEGDSYASIVGSTLTGVAEGSVTVKAEQAAAGNYNAGEASATITVNAALTLSSIAITTAPTKTTYTEGETFDPTGMVVTATYSDSSTGDVTSSCTYTPTTALTPSDTEITVSYTENAVEKTTTQAITVSALPKYTVTFGDGGSVTQASYGAEVTLPSRSEKAGYAFAGWSETNVASETTVAPTIIPAGDYTPTANITLYPVYSKTVGGGGTQNKSASVNIGTYATANGWSNSTKYTSATLDENVTASVSNGGGNTGKYYESNSTWRFYANESGELTISTTSGELTSITITYTGNTLTYGGNNVTSGTAVSVSGTSAAFAVSGNSSNSQVTAISVDYTIAGGGTTYYWSAPVAAAVEMPSIVVAENPFLFSTTATITCITEGAAIKYSYDGANWNNYEDALTITETKTIYAKAVKDEKESTVASVTATKNLATPTVAISGDLTVDLNGETNVDAGTLTAAVTYNDAAVVGAVVTWSSSNTTVATIDENTGAVTIKARGTVTFTATYAANSDYAEATETKTITVTDSKAPGSADKPYTVAQALAASPSAGVYVGGTISAITEVNTSYHNATYTITDGENTMTVFRGRYLNDTDFTNNSQIAVGDVVVVYGTLSVYNEKNQLAQGNYLTSLVRKVATPTFSPAAGAVAEGTEVTISTSTEGATIYYTTDGNEPTTSSTKYTEPITINAAVTIKAIAVKDGTPDSDVATAAYTIAAPCATPTFSPAAGTYTEVQYVEISSTTEDATIYYTTNGTEPTTSSTVYTSAITVDEDMTIKAIAVKNGMANSAVAEAVYEINLPDYATLPFEYDGNATGVLPSGLTQVGLGTKTYANSPKIGFDTTADELVLKINEAASKLSFDIKGNNFSDGTFKVQTSVDGESFTDLETYTELGATQTETFALDVDIRYIKWIYTEKASGNVGLGNIKVTNDAADVVSITVSAAGLATFASDSKLDFKNVENLEAYIAKENGSTIELHKVNKVPAGTGVLLRAKNDATDFNVPVTTATADDVTGNLFVRGNDAAVATGSGPYNWILSKKGDVVGFYQANGNKVAKNRAYLQTSTASARISLDFDDEDVTAISNVNRETITNNGYFNLAGQRVAQPTKGLYIVNGKKVVIK